MHMIYDPAYFKPFPDFTISLLYEGTNATEMGQLAAGVVLLRRTNRNLAGRLI